MSAAFAQLFCIIGAMVLSPIVTIHSYGLTIQSWPWLVLGSLAQLALLAAGGGLKK